MNRNEFKTLFDCALSAPSPTLRDAYSIQPIMTKAEALGNAMRDDSVLMVLAPDEAAMIESMRKSMRDAAEAAAKQVAANAQITEAVKTALQPSE